MAWSMASLLGSCRASSVDKEPPPAVQLSEAPGPVVEGLIEEASLALPPALLVDFYGARAAGHFLAFGLARGDRPPSGEGDPRVMSTALGVVDVRRKELRILPAVRAGWWISAVAGAGDWLLTRERRPEPATACADNPDCWSWALYAHHLPSAEALLLAASTKPGGQLGMPEPRNEGMTFAWLQGDGARDSLSVETWSPDATAAAPPRELGRVDAGTVSPFLSVSGGRVWLDERDPAGGLPALRALGLSQASDTRARFDVMAFSPVVSGAQLAFVTAELALAEDDPGQRRVVRLALPGADGGRLPPGRALTSATDVWDLAWLDRDRLVVAGSLGVEVLAPARSSPRLALLPDEGATAVRVGDGRLVTVKREGDRDVVRSYVPAESSETQLQTDGGNERR